MKGKKYKTLKDIRLVGIYFLFRAGKLIYIGQTIDLHTRLSSHMKSKCYFDTFRFIACDNSKLLYYEKRLILFFRPRYNSIRILKKEIYSAIKKKRFKPSIDPAVIQKANERLMNSPFWGQ